MTPGWWLVVTIVGGALLTALGEGWTRWYIAQRKRVWIGGLGFEFTPGTTAVWHRIDDVAEAVWDVLADCGLGPQLKNKLWVRVVLPDHPRRTRRRWLLFGLVRRWEITVQQPRYRDGQPTGGAHGSTLPSGIRDLVHRLRPDMYCGSVLLSRMRLR